MNAPNIPFSKYLKIVVVADGDDPQVRGLLEVEAGRGFEIELSGEVAGFID